MEENNVVYCLVTNDTKYANQFAQYVEWISEQTKLRLYIVANKRATASHGPTQMDAPSKLF